jgi:hypothetical protein
MTLIHEYEQEISINLAIRWVIPRQRHRDLRPVAGERIAAIQKRSYGSKRKIIYGTLEFKTLEESMSSEKADILCPPF